MKALFSFFTGISLRFRYVTLLLVAVVLVLGGVAISQLNQELLPPIEFPQTIILAQVSGMTSDQVLNVVTKRLEESLDKVDEVVNLESTTTGAFGSVITARNNFGVNQVKLINKIQAAVDEVWLPQRRIEPAEGANPQDFAKSLLSDLTPDSLIYIASKDTSFLFQLTPEIWATFSDDTVKQVLAYLSNQVAQTGGSALQQLVDQEIAPQLGTLDLVARVQVSGGQALPGDATVLASNEIAKTESLLLQLSPEVWSVVAPKAGLTALDDTAVKTLQAVEYTVPTTVPALPASWQMDHFSDAGDLLEVRTLTVTAAGLFNKFYTSGYIAGALGQTNDLTPETVTQFLAIDPGLVNYFDADQLAALPADVFAVLPQEYIAGLDGFTRDALAAAALAKSVTGKDAVREPVDLPTQWQIAPPQIITFSFADLPLATFSLSTKAVGTASDDNSLTTAPQDDTTDTATDVTSTTDQTDTTVVVQDIPEGPALPLLFSALGGFLGIELNTADDLINIQLPEAQAAQFGGGSLSAGQLLNFLMLLADPSNLPAGVEVPSIPINPTAIIGAFSPDAVAFLAQYDPTFLPTISADVFNAFSDEVLALPQIAPPLGDVWSALAGQPQFADTSLKTAGDLVAIGGGKASTVLNTINSEIPEQYAGYEVRLFDSLSPAAVRYLAQQEPDFYKNLE
ncbi:MAG TPA: efflux RND transporter permease subunit, partial [Phototrophicaceae bacterium]|nr:efflux RND transporter permease subunit [Phototrophicaceae bacterium]